MMDAPWTIEPPFSDVAPELAPPASGRHGRVSEQYRQRMLANFAAAIAALHGMSAALRFHPDDDAMLDRYATQVGEALQPVLVDSQRFRDLRECAGSA